MAKNTSINRQQNGITPAFVFTKYKVQKAKFDTVVFDL